MNNKIKIRNILAARSRWNKVHIKEEQYIKNHHNIHLKARIFGYIAGDGNISIRVSQGGKEHHDIRFFPDHESLIKVFCEAFKKVYNREPIIKTDKKFYRLRVYSKPIVLDMLKYAKFGLHKWTVPSFLKDKKSKIEWIRAFFDAEAYVGPTHIKVHSVNQTGLSQIKNMLWEDFEIKSKIYSYIPKNINHSTQYLLLIMSKEMRKKYLKEIGFFHKLKKDKLLNSLR